ncbi:MAG: hypothetical protein ACP5SH_08140 [Syntrophobacteraceae bacterium]
MKAGVLLLTAVAIAGVTFAGVCTVLHTGSPKTERVLLADRIETKDSVTYTTDPGLDRAMQKEDEEEKQKEIESWKMLQNLHLYGPSTIQPFPHKQDASPAR